MLSSLFTRTGTVAVATKYAGYFYCYSYDKVLDISLFFTLMLFMLQLKASTGDEVILKAILLAFSYSLEIPLKNFRGQGGP